MLMNNVKIDCLPHSVCRITSPFGYRVHPITQTKQSFHQGIDIALDGDYNIYAVANGKVVRSANMPDKINGYGYYVVIEHEGFCTLYAHMQGLLLKEGQSIKAGDKVGLIGSTGASTGAHLHFELEVCNWANYWVKENGIRKNAVDGYKYIEEFRQRQNKTFTVQEAYEYIKKEAQLVDSTMTYLKGYKYESDLLIKLAKLIYDKPLKGKTISGDIISLFKQITQFADKTIEFISQDYKYGTNLISKLLKAML